MDNFEAKGWAFLEEGKYEEALQNFEKSINSETGSVQSLYGKAESLRNLANYEEALKYFTATLQLDSHFSLAFSGKGNTLRMLGRYKEAQIWLKKRISNGPK